MKNSELNCSVEARLLSFSDMRIYKVLFVDTYHAALPSNQVIKKQTLKQETLTFLMSVHRFTQLGMAFAF